MSRIMTDAQKIDMAKILGLKNIPSRQFRGDSAHKIMLAAFKRAGKDAGWLIRTKMRDPRRDIVLDARRVTSVK